MKFTRRFVGVTSKAEEPIVNIQFNVYKFSNRPKPEDKTKRAIICCFSEFGCETIGCLFIIPKILGVYPHSYKIAVGWYGRDYLYRHLVDEFWEIKEEYQWLRDYCKAFHHHSKNLTRLEKKLESEGRVFKSASQGSMIVGNKCNVCHHFWGGYIGVVECPQCKSKDFAKSIFSDIKTHKKLARLIPKPSKEKMQAADKYLKNNAVGIFARGRKTYHRNLQPEFYTKLIYLLESLGYNPIWLGEKQSTQPCPVSHILDFSRLLESRDLELTCAIVSKLKFTIQFWTASSRLSAIMGVPYILFESPMQIYGDGQEGLRLGLLKDFAPLKLIICHYLSVLENHEEAMKLVEKGINEMNANNYKPIIGMVEDQAYTEILRLTTRERLGIEC